MPLKSLIYSLLLFPSLCVLSAGQGPADLQSQTSLHMRLAQQYLSEQRPELALPELQKVVELDPNNVDARGNLGVLLYFRGNYADAVTQLRAAVSLSPDLWKLQALLGLGEGRLGDLSPSQADLEAAFPHLKDVKFQYPNIVKLRSFCRILPAPSISKSHARCCWFWRYASARAWRKHSLRLWSMSTAF
jgi:tetratricopeptide (TPR) repeat protein